jgi:hypothetical protein
MDHPLRHPIFERLITPADPFARHALLHDMELQLAQIQHGAGLRARVHSFVARGVPYFAPADSHYREWAARAAQLWDELHQRAGAAAQSTLV